MTLSKTLTASAAFWTSIIEVPEELNLKLDRTEALELLAVVQATLNAIARSKELTVGAAILTGIKAKLIDALEAG